MTRPAPRPSIDEIDSLALGDEQRFRREVAEPCRPAIFRGAFRDWPAVRAAGESPAELRTYLGRFATGVPAEAFVGDPSIAGRYAYADRLEGFNFERIRIDLEGALDRILAGAAAPGSPSVYVGSLETEIHLPGFAHENRVAAIPPSVGPRIWIGNASNVSCHNDTFDNLACVVAGKRRFTLYPPAAVADLYVGPIDFTMAGRPVGLAAGSSPGDARYPGFERWRDRATVVELEPGDALYLPKLWWHQVEATEPFNILVNYWWDAFRQGPDAPNLTMMLAMIAIAERPAAERAAWRALFDHYVFRPGGHPLAHLPAERHGILGPLRDNYGRIRATVMQALRGG
ncbi:MAG TPA: cupin-like domain-containing protein [Allosphingosinicella sp.]|nr:cupin-like domain-containing protein [Allosphingosinicella sp.]